MLPKNQLRRSIARIGISMATERQRKVNEPSAYRLCEREWQVQIQVSGHLGTLPTESDIRIPFDTYFTTMAGMARDSQLEYPQARLAFHIANPVAGMIPYAYVNSWIQDDSDQFTGCHVTVGVHYPALTILQNGYAGKLAWQGILHASFQGYGWPWDPDGDQEAGGS